MRFVRSSFVLSVNAVFEVSQLLSDDAGRQTKCHARPSVKAGSSLS